MILDLACTNYAIVPLIKTIRAIFLMMEIIAPIIAIISLIRIFVVAMTTSNEKEVKKQYLN